IKDLQTHLKSSGDYTGNIDGNWGKETAAAAKAYGARMNADYTNEQAAKKAQAEAAAAAAKAEGEKATASANTAATALQGQENAKRAADAEKFNKFAESYKANDRGYWDSFEAGHPALAGLAKALAYAGIGYATQRGVGRYATGKAAEDLADRVASARSNVNAAARAQKAGFNNAGNRADAAGELNEYWARSPSGNPDAAVAFKLATVKGVSKGVPPATDLYQPKTLASVLATEGIGVGTAGIENAAELWRGYERLEAAQEAYKQAKTDYDKAGFTPEGARKL